MHTLIDFEVKISAIASVFPSGPEPSSQNPSYGQPSEDQKSKARDEARVKISIMNKDHSGIYVCGHNLKSSRSQLVEYLKFETIEPLTKILFNSPATPILKTWLEARQEDFEIFGFTATSPWTLNIIWGQLDDVNASPELQGFKGMSLPLPEVYQLRPRGCMSWLVIVYEVFQVQTSFDLDILHGIVFSYFKN